MVTGQLEISVSGPAVAQHENIRINIWFLCNLTHFWAVETESDVKNG